MDDERLRLAIVIGGGPDRTDRAVTDWLTGQVHRRGDAEVDVIDLAAACLPDASCGGLYGPTPSAVRDLTPWLADADGFVIVLADGLPTSLRNAVAWCDEGWRAKPVAFTRVGDRRDDIPDGAPDEPQLRSIFAAIPAVTVPGAVSFDDRHRTDQAEQILDELTWWARPLRAARATTRYPLRRK